MRMIHRFAIFAAIALCAGTSRASDDAVLLFHASFNKGLDADFAKGCPTATGCAEITEGEKGFSGEALIAKTGWYGVEQYTGIKYLLAGNLRYDEGTIEFYVKPLPGFFTGKKDWRKIFVCMFNKVFENNIRLYRWFRIDFRKIKGKHRLRVFERDMHTGQKSHIQKLSPEWKIGEWYHIAYCWKDKKRVLFVNGAIAASGTAALTGLPQAGARLFVGSGPFGGRQAPHCLIDELKIWSKPKY